MASEKRTRWEAKRRKIKKRERSVYMKRVKQPMGISNMAAHKKRHIIETAMHAKQEGGNADFISDCKGPGSSPSIIDHLGSQPATESLQSMPMMQMPDSVVGNDGPEGPWIPGSDYFDPMLADFALGDRFVESEHNGEYEQLIRSSLKLFRIPESTHLVVVAVDKRDGLNKYEMVRCVGEPIGGYAYDVTHDAYYLRCAEYLPIGSIPVSYKMAMPNSNWVEFVALPDELLERCLTQQQKQVLNQFRERWRDERYAVQFLQSIDC